MDFQSDSQSLALHDSTGLHIDDDRYNSSLPLEEGAGRETNAIGLPLNPALIQALDKSFEELEHTFSDLVDHFGQMRGAVATTDEGPDPRSDNKRGPIEQRLDVLEDLFQVSRATLERATRDMKLLILDQAKTIENVASIVSENKSLTEHQTEQIVAAVDARLLELQVFETNLSQYQIGWQTVSVALIASPWPLTFGFAMICSHLAIRAWL
ncbi:hypothetical protein SISSUDRAFT_1036955 [Sistotremastrum suecicum HHB10207 ss-3]|uniref:Uncharacterized protein n=1 Tax=Sistotremastrum suecicum HHB10207 ss-3 TaxID=1314776 RepID=A0A165YSC5_9AGAM|nr:hypothetical protein SISSUDRAFT_1036955 [Sistotremastrum suecicum HHB10207 ss-3]